MAQVVVDWDRCEGHGLCEATAPEIFRLDDEGELHILVEDIPAELAVKAAAGTRVCPVAALRLSP